MTTVHAVERPPGQRVLAFVAGGTTVAGALALAVISVIIGSDAGAAGWFGASIAVVAAVPVVAQGTAWLRACSTRVELRIERDGVVVDDETLLRTPLHIPRRQVIGFEAGPGVEHLFRDPHERGEHAVILSPFAERPNARLRVRPSIGFDAARRGVRLAGLWPARPPRRGDRTTTVWVHLANPLEAHAAFSRWLPPGAARWIPRG